MKKELGIARCGLACCLCSENEHCGGCDSGNCPDTEWCEVSVKFEVYEVNLC